MKKIALLHYAYPPKIGGVEKLMSEQAALLSEQGYDILVLTGVGKEPNSKIKLTEVPELQAILKFAPELQNKILSGVVQDEELLALTRTIGKKLEEHLVDRDVVIVHNMLTLVHNLPFVQAFKAYVQKHPEKKIIVWTHDQTFIDNGQVLTEKPGVNLHPDSKNLLLTPLPQATYVIISETFKKLLLKVMKLDSSQTRVIPNGVNLKSFLEIDTAIWELFKGEQILRAYPILLSPVNILERKNLDFSLETVSHLTKIYPELKYIISGLPSEHRDTDIYYQKIKQTITKLRLERQVFFLGEKLGRAMVDSELHDLYDLADVVLYFSKQENFGLPILEAALAKTPIWVSNLAVFREVGGEFLRYINPASHTPAQTAALLAGFLETNSLARLNHKVRNSYDLAEIIKSQLIPLLET